MDSVLNFAGHWRAILCFERIFDRHLPAGGELGDIECQGFTVLTEAGSSNWVRFFIQMFRAIVGSAFVVPGADVEGFRLNTGGVKWLGEANGDPFLVSCKIGGKMGRLAGVADAEQATFFTGLRGGPGRHAASVKLAVATLTLSPPAL